MRIIILFISFIFTVAHLKSQNLNPADVIEFARSKAYQKDFIGADKLLTEYNSHQKDINALRLHAQVLYWMKDFDRSVKTYEKTLANYPNIAVVKLDYARMLFEMGKFKRARSLLLDFIETDNLHAEANIMLAYINLWAGDIQPAKYRADLLLEHYPGNKEATDILKQIHTYTAPYITVGANFQSDDQPKTGTGFAIEAGVYRSRFLSPMLQLQYNNFKITDGSYPSLWIEAGNKINYGKGSGLSLAAGLFQQINSGNNYFTGSVGLTQKISRYFTGEAGIVKRPYQYSVASLKNAVFENILSVAAGFNKGEKWLGKAGFQRENFADGNNINTSYLWFLAPLVIRKNFKIQAGYAFSYANADKNIFVAAAPLTTLINTFPLYGSVPGVYDPYFTIKNQIINALLASVNITLSPKVQLSSRTNIGVYAKADNPYLFLEKNTANQQYFINKGYSTLKYTPVEWVSNLQFKLSPQFSIQIDYSYQKFLFYTNNLGGIQLKYNFVHGPIR